MRLTCPNCGARYEVDEAMIPPEGRDVQCSNCTTTWFQPGIEPGIAEVIGATPPPEPPSPAHREPTRPIPVSEAGHAQSRRRELDPDVRDVLREEAERETALRQQEAGLPDYQDEMALDDHDEVSSSISDLISEVDDYDDLADAPRDMDHPAVQEDRIEAEIAAAAAASAGSAASRRDLLPDIEEINSTLRATETRSTSDPVTSDVNATVERPRRRTGARLGFGLVALIFAGLIAVYANAARISEALPPAAPILDIYVAQVDALRLWINDIAQGALTDTTDIPADAQTPPAPEPAPEPEPVSDTEEAAPTAEDTEPTDEAADDGTADDEAAATE